MTECCSGGNGTQATPIGCACTGNTSTGINAQPECALTYFKQMIPNCLAYAKAQHEAGIPIVGILCEYTPRELIMAAGAIPVCLCGGSAKTIPPAEADLPALLCPLIKSTYGYHLMQSNPFLEMASLIVAETTCDGKKKMYELMAQTRPMHVIQLPQRPDDPNAFAYWMTELRAFKTALEERFGVKITSERLRNAIALMNQERALRRGLAELTKADAPPLSGRELLDLKSSIAGIPEDHVQYARALDQLSTRKPLIGNCVRVLLTGVPTVHGAERVVELIEQHHGLIVCMENCTGIKPIIEDVVMPERAETGTDDEEALLEAIARKYYHLPCSVMAPNDARLALLEQLAREYRADCIIDLVWHGCLTYAVESARVKRHAEEKLHLPYLCIDTDYNPADSARLATRIEALFETIEHGACCAR